MITLVGSPSQTQAPQTGTTPASPAASHTLGNLLVVVIQFTGGASNSVLGVANTATDTWLPTPKSPFNNASANPANNQAMYYVLSTKGSGADIVTVTLANTQNYATVTVYEFHTTLNTFAFVDDEDGSAQSNTIASGTLTLGGQACALVEVFESDQSGAGAAVAPANGFTQLGADAASTPYVLTGYLLTSSDVTAGGTTTPAGNWGILAGAWKEVAAAGVSLYAPGPFVTSNPTALH